MKRNRFVMDDEDVKSLINLMSTKPDEESAPSAKDPSPPLRQEPSLREKSLFLKYRTKGGGTCKQGERSDLTGCTPASGDPSSQKQPSKESKPQKGKESSGKGSSKASDAVRQVIELQKQLKKARGNAHKQIVKAADGLMKNIDGLWNGVYEGYGQISSSGDDDDEFSEAFNEYETILYVFNESESHNELYSLLGDIEEYANTMLNIEQPVTKDITEKDIADNKKILKNSVLSIGKIREHYKEYARLKKEWRRIEASRT